MSEPLTDEELDRMERQFYVDLPLIVADGRRLVAEMRRLRQLEAGTQRLLADVRGTTERLLQRTSDTEEDA